jgi:hypothetical protein
MAIRNKVRRATVNLLKEISRRETNYLYLKGKLDQINYLSRIQYPQTWWMKKYIPLNLCRRWIVYKGKYLHNPLYYILTSLCGLLTGHEKSATEHGYGGGDYIDCNCRWCDKVILEPIEESKWAKEGELRNLITDMRDGQGPILEEGPDEA